MNSFTGNTWRIQMLKTLLAYAETPEMKSKLTELKVISTGTDVAAQIAAMEDFINQGYDAVLADAISTEGFDRVIRAADRTGTIVMTFDNVLNNENILQLSSDNVESGRLQGEFLAKHMNGKGKLLEVRGLAGSSVEEDRHNGLTKVIKQYGDIEVVEVWGNWDDGTGQKVVADAIATHGKFDGMSVQAGTTGAMRALLDAKHPLIPVAGEAENGYRKIMAEKKAEGLEAPLRRLFTCTWRNRGQGSSGSPRRSCPSPTDGHPSACSNFGRTSRREELLVGSRRQFLHAQ
ncbi:substrate-binding domain-containing protein [uncultured Cohaesibacter sp.]|uniref:substrate-binding domain-containing protein n=1 Tax=uncultured Cohaesibacter sp. TaxID=1002546 RepID=UPI0029C87C85|nr:substrate-binding domain-containing protein [uncultured Cohaesibacter sp.]